MIVRIVVILVWCLQYRVKMYFEFYFLLIILLYNQNFLLVLIFHVNLGLAAIAWGLHLFSFRSQK